METKAFILQETFGLLLRKGYRGVSVTDIQQATGMARGLLYHYFGNLDKLFEEAAEKYLYQWWKEEKTLLKEKNITGLIANKIEKYQQIVQEMQENWEERLFLGDGVVLFYEMARHMEKFREVYETIVIERRAIWRMAVLNSFSRSELRSGLNLESVIRYFICIEEDFLLSFEVRPLNNEVIYSLEKGLREFFEIVRR